MNNENVITIREKEKPRSIYDIIIAKAQKCK